MPISIDPDLLYAGVKPSETGGVKRGSGGDWQQLFDELSTDLETKFGFKREYAQRQLKKESGGSNKATSWAGAKGLMQLMPGTAKRYGVTDPTDPVQNLKGWHGYMTDLLTMFDGDTDKAIAAYNAGEGAVQKYGLEKVRKFSNLPKGSPGRGGYKGSTGEYVDKIKGLEDIRALNSQLTKPLDASGATHFTPPDPGADIQYALQHTPKESRRGAYGSLAAKIRKQEPTDGLTGSAGPLKTPEQKPSKHPVLDFMVGALGSPLAAGRYIPESTRRNLVEGATGAVGSIARGYEHAYLQTTYPSSYQAIAEHLGNEYVPSVGQKIINNVGEAQAERPQPATRTGRFRQALERGIGSSAVQLPALFAGSPALGAANLPMQMGLQGLGESGYGGAIKGGAEGLVYHFGMGFTAPLGRVGNALIWGSLAGGETLATGGSPEEALASGINMAGLSAVGPKRVEVKLENGTTRPARPQDLIKIARGKLEVVPPTPETAAAYAQAMNEGGGFHKDTPAQAGIRIEKQSHLDKMEAIRQKRLAKQFPELQQEDRVTPARAFSTEPEDRTVEPWDEPLKVAADESPVPVNLVKTKDETRNDLRSVQYEATIEGTRVSIEATIDPTTGRASVDMIEGADKALPSQALGTSAMLSLKRQLMALHPEVKSVFFERSGSTGGEQTRERIINLNQPKDQTLVQKAEAELAERMSPFELKVVQKAFEKAGEADRLFGYLNVKKQLDNGVEPRALKFLSYEAKESPMENGRYTPDDSDFDFMAEQDKNVAEFVKKATAKGRLTPYFAKLFSKNTPVDVRYDALRRNPKFAGASDAFLERLSIADISDYHLAGGLAENLGEPIAGTNAKLIDTSWRLSRESLERTAKSEGVVRAAQEISKIFESVRDDLKKHNYVFGEVEFGGIDLGNDRHYAYNRDASLFSDYKNRIFLSLHNEIAAINALERMDYIKPEDFSKAVATHVMETLYHEFTHQGDPKDILPAHEDDIGHEGHNKEFDQRYLKTLEVEADNLLKYRDQLQKALEHQNERIINDLGQQALNTGLLDDFADHLKSAARNPFNSNTSERRFARTGAINRGSSKLSGIGRGENAGGLHNYSGVDPFPLYKGFHRERLIEWAEKRRENLDRFMGEKNIFRKEDGSYEALYHGTDADFTTFKKGDIGFHFGTKAASNAALGGMSKVLVRGEGYERVAMPKELNGERPLGDGETLIPASPKGKVQILPVHIKLENPMEFSDINNFNGKRLLDEAIKRGYITEADRDEILQKTAPFEKKPDQLTPDGKVKEAKFASKTRTDYARELFESKGYDGIKYKNLFEDAGSTSYIVFRPEQIKSAIGNTGEFNPHDPNILHASDPVSLAIKSAVETGRLLYKAGVKFADWSRGMVEKFGPGIRIHLENLWHAVVNFHNDERGFINLGAKKFLDEDVAPAAKSSGIALHAAWDTILKRFAPAARGVDAKEMAGLVRQKGSELWLKFFRAEHALNSARSVLDSLPKADRWEFIDHIENGRAQTNPALQPIADVMRRLLDEGRYSVQHLGTGKLSTFYEHYFPHIWKDPARAQQVFSAMFMGKRPLAGKKSFLKRRTFPTFADGIAAGLEPVSDNPVDLILLKNHEVNKYVMGVQIMQELKGRGMAKFVKAGKIEFEKTQGMVEINDTIASVFGGGAATPQGGQLLRGKYMVSDAAGQVINNYLSPGLRKNAAFRGYMTLANSMNQLQLGWSLFHAGFTTADAMISKQALAQQYLVAGKPLKAIENLIRANPITAPIENVYRGHQVLKEAMNPGTAPQYAEIVKKLTAGGFRPKMEKIYTNDMVTKFKEAIRSGNYPGAVFRAPLALTEAIAHPILEQLVPRQKLGVAADLVRFELDRNPNMNVYEQRQVIGKIVDSVDNRLGQMTYDNLFWNRTAKDLAMFSVRSVGWNLGTFREIGGGAFDLARVPVDLIRGEKPKFTTRASYVIALPIYAAFLGAITMYLYTGKGPEEFKDYYFPRTGNLDERGNPERVNLPTYIKDLYHYRDLGGPHTRKTLVSKLHPAIGLIADMIRNEDYFGVEIHNEDDSFMERRKDDLKFLGKSVLPFGLQNFQKERERGSGLGKSLVPILTGITPAPSDINQTQAEEELYEYNQKTRPAGTRTKYQAERSKTMFEIKKSILKQDGQAGTKTTKAIQDGILTTDDLSEIIKQLSKSPLQTRFAGTDPFEAIKVWNLMSDKEKMEVQDLMKTKTAKVMELPPAQQQRLLEKYKVMMEYYKQRGTTP